MVLHSNLVLIEELMLEVTPSPLAIVAIAKCAVAHGGIAHKEEHRMVALAAGTRHWTYLVSLCEAVAGDITDAIHVLRPVLGRHTRYYKQHQC